MARERYRSSSRLNDDFDTSLMYDDIEKIRNIEEEEEKDQNNKLGSAGMMAFVAGASMLLGVILTSIPGFPSAEPILRMLEVFLPAVGVGALGYGLIKMVNLVFRRKELNFPALNVYRKTKPAAQKSKSTFSSDPKTRTRDASREQARERYRQRARSYVNTSTATGTGRTSGRKMLRRSRANRVFSGVAGGISEYTGASVSLIRFAFVAGLFIPPFAPMTILLYLLLSIVLPANFDPYNENKGL